MYTCAPVEYNNTGCAGMIQRIRCVCSLLVFADYRFPVDVLNIHGGFNPFLELFMQPI